MVENLETAEKHKIQGKNPSCSQSHHTESKGFLPYC